MSEFTENLRAPAIVGSKITRKKGINRVQFAPDTLPGFQVRIALSIIKHENIEHLGYTVYTIQCWCAGRSWLLQRRYKNFESLHHDLESHYFVKEKYIKLPSLPRKRWFEKQRWINKNDPKYSFHRRLALQDYLRALIRISALLDYSDALNNFLEFKTHTEGINLEYNGELSKFYEEEMLDNSKLSSSYRGSSMSVGIPVLATITAIDEAYIPPQPEDLIEQLSISQSLQNHNIFYEMEPSVYTHHDGDAIAGDDITVHEIESALKDVDYNSTEGSICSDSRSFSERETVSRRISFPLRSYGDDEVVTYSGYQSTNRRISDNNVKIDQSVIDKYSHDSKNSTDTVDVAVNSKNSLLANMLLGGNDK